MADNPFSTYLYRQRGTLFPELLNPSGPVSWGVTNLTGTGTSRFPSLFSPTFFSSSLSSFPSLFFRDKNGFGNLADAAKAFAAAATGQKSTSSGTGSKASSGSGSTLTGGNESVMKWSNDINDASKQLGVPADVIAGIMEIESGGDPGAISSAGATGLMQVMPNYHADRAAKYGGNLTDPRTNIFTGADLLKENFDRAKKLYGLSDNESWNIAAAAYLGDWNWNSGQYAGSSDAYGTDGPEYVQRFNAARSHYQTQQAAAAQVPGGHPSLYSTTGGQHYTITQEFGPSDLAGEPSYNGYDNFHMGVDIGTPMNTPITSPIGGTVISAQADGGFGNSVVVQLDDGTTMRLGHLNSFAVDAGQRVDAGALLGYSGSTGYSTGPHLHVELHDAEGNPIDPRNYFTFD